MKNVLLLFVIFVSCSKDISIEPVKTAQGKIENRDLIDQNFFEYGSQPYIELQYGEQGELCLEGYPPILNGSFETLYEYEWSFTRCKGCGSDSCSGKNITIKALKGSNIILRVQGYRVGTNIKSDYFYQQIKVQ